MSNKYKNSCDVPNSVLCERLAQLSDAVTKGKKGIDREFYMSIPAQLDNDADLVISEAKIRIMKLEKNLLDLIRDAKDCCDEEMQTELYERIQNLAL